MWDNQAFESDLYGGGNFKQSNNYPVIKTTQIDTNDNMRGFRDVETKTPAPQEDENDDEKQDKKTCGKKFATLMLSHLGTFIIVVLYLVMGGFLFEYLEVENEKSGCQEKYEKYIAKKDETVGIVYNIAQSGNSTSSKSSIEKELEKFAENIYTLSVDPQLNCTTLGEGDNLPAWNVANSIYFCATIVTTIGYGHISPSTKWGQIVCMIYSILGIPIMLLFLAKIGAPTAMLFRSFYLNICCCKCFLKKKKDESNEGNDNTKALDWNAVEDGKNEHKLPPQKVNEVVVVEDDEDEEDEVINIPITVTIMILIIYVLIGAAVFSIWEKEWTTIEGAYFSFVTLSTIGFGDYVPGKDGPFNEVSVQVELLVAAIYCVFGLALLSMCMNLIQDEIAAKFSWIGKKLGINQPKPEEDEESDSDDSEESDDEDDGRKTAKSSKSSKPQNSARSRSANSKANLVAGESKA